MSGLLARPRDPSLNLGLGGDVLMILRHTDGTQPLTCVKRLPSVGP